MKFIRNLLAGLVISLSLILGSAAVAQAAPAPSCATTLVGYGSTGACAKDAQQLLLKAGFNPGPIDGKFFKNSVAATKALQSAKGLKQDGIVGPLTRSVAANGFVTTAPSASAPQNPLWKQALPRIAREVYDQNVLKGAAAGKVTYMTKTGLETLVQKRLQFHRDVRGESFYLDKADGTFGDASMNALLGFQRDRGLPNTGVVDAATMTALTKNVQSHVKVGPPTLPKTGRVTIASIAQQTIWFVENGKIVRTEKVRTGGWNKQQNKKDPNYGRKKVFRSGIDEFRIKGHDKNPNSSTYGLNSMPWPSMFASTMYIHASRGFELVGYAGSSHACLNVTTPVAKWAFTWTKVGDRVVIIPA